MAETYHTDGQSNIISITKSRRYPITATPVVPSALAPIPFLYATPYVHGISFSQQLTASITFNPSTDILFFTSYSALSHFIHIPNSFHEIRNKHVRYIAIDDSAEPVMQPGLDPPIYHPCCHHYEGTCEKNGDNIAVLVAGARAFGSLEKLFVVKGGTCPHVVDHVAAVEKAMKERLNDAETIWAAIERKGGAVMNKWGAPAVVCIKKGDFLGQDM